MPTIGTPKDRTLLVRMSMLVLLAGCTADGERTEVAALELMGSETATSGEAVDFTAIRDLLVDSVGNVYVLDGAAEIPVLTADGALLRTVGGHGAGPGEFRVIGSAALGGGDTLFVYDMDLSRLTAFEPGTNRVASVVHLRQQYPLFPAVVRRSADGRLVALYRRVYAEDDGREEGKPQMDLVRLLDANGEILRDTLMLLREDQHVSISDGSWGAVYHYPFGRRSILRLASDGRIVTLWTDSARFEVHSPEGKLVRTIEARVPPTRRPVTALERDSLIHDYAPDGQRLPAIRRALDRMGHDTWPLVHDFILDDRDRIWYAPVPPRDATSNTWMALDEQGNTVERLTLPINATPHVIRGTRAYVSETDSLDVPRVVIYDLQPAPPSRNR